MNENPELHLDQHDRSTVMWLKLDAYLTARLDLLRRKNDALTLTPEQTAALRGQIQELKALHKDLSAAGASQD